MEDLQIEKEEREKRKWCVYMHVNKINGKKYIGQTCQNPETRWEKGNGYKRNPHFWSAICKYGWDSFEHKIIASNLTLEEANNMEEYYIALFDTMNQKNGYNMQSGGNNRLHIEETKEKIRQSHLGMIVSKETREKLSIVKSGENHPFYGTHRSEETKKKIGEAQIGEKNHMWGTHHTEEWKENVRQKLLGAKSPNAKAVVQLSINLEFIKKWGCVSEAQKALNIKGGISRVCKGKQKTAGGFKWMYLEDYERMINKNAEDGNMQ